MPSRHITSLIALAITLAACGDEPLGPVDVGLGAERVFSTHREVDVGFVGVDGAVLAGTIILPPDRGSYGGLILHFGSDPWTRVKFEDSPGLQFWLDEGFAVLTYDKRGVGRSQGECCPWQDPGHFPLLGGDVLAGVRMMGTHPEIEPSRIGAWGFSQGGWVVPVAAAVGAGEIAFTIIGSGPTVTLGEELLYSQLTGDAACEPSGLSEEEIEEALNKAGPSLFDPLPYLRAMPNPGLWIYGELDTSVPVERSIEILSQLRDEEGQDFTWHVLPRANHNWILDGAICQTDGPTVEVSAEFVSSWLAPRLPPLASSVGARLALRPKE